MFIFLLLNFKNSFCILDRSPLSCRHFHPVHGFSFYSCNSIFQKLYNFELHFRSIIHFMLIFVETVRSMSRTCFFWIWINAQVFFLLCITIAPVSKNSWQYLCEPITNTYLSCSINLFVYYFINVMLFWLLKLYSHLKVR